MNEDPLGLRGQIFGPFRVERALAHAPSGLRYHGRDLTRLNGTVPSPVWLQFFHKQRANDPELVRKQADAWRYFRHPAFVNIVGCETATGQPPLVATEVAEGMLLTERLAATAMPVAEVAKLALLICELLVDAHRRGLVHLGLSLESILLPRGGSGGPRLCGVGLHTGFDWSDIEAFQFLAPEQVAKRECDERTDVYSLGVVMFRCAVGKFPSDLRTPQTQLADIGSGERRLRREWFPMHAEPLANIIERCMQIDPADRFQTSLSLADALRACGLLQLNHQGWTAPPAVEPSTRASGEQSTLTPTPIGRMPTPPAVAGLAASHLLASDDNLIGRQVKEVRIERLIDEGGSSRIYLARHSRVPRSWVVKVGTERRLDLAKCFEQEARVTATLRQRGAQVAEVIDWDILDGQQPYIVMEYVEGRSLDKVLAATPRLPEEQCLAIVLQVCEVLSHAHDLGILHRDLKPANILVEERNGKPTGRVIVLDWGMARGSGDERIQITDVGTILGTAGYRAPETAIGWDGRADTFSLATVLYEMLAGRRAFEGHDEDSSTLAVNRHYPPELVTIRPGIPPALSEIVSTGMAKDPQKRPNMVSFWKSLDRYVKKGGPNEDGVVGPRRASSEGAVNTPVLSQMPTELRLNTERRDILGRLIEQPKTKQLPARQARNVVRKRRSRRGSILTFVAAIGTSSLIVGGVYWWRSAHQREESVPSLTISTVRAGNDTTKANGVTGPAAPVERIAPSVAPPSHELAPRHVMEPVATSQSLNRPAPLTTAANRDSATRAHKHHVAAAPTLAPSSEPAVAAPPEQSRPATDDNGPMNPF